jgi:hypothetical protein
MKCRCSSLYGHIQHSTRKKEFPNNSVLRDFSSIANLNVRFFADTNRLLTAANNMDSLRVYGGGGAEAARSRYRAWLQARRPRGRSSSLRSLNIFASPYRSGRNGVHRTAYPVGTGGSFPEGKAAGVWNWPLTSI